LADFSVFLWCFIISQVSFCLQITGYKKA